MRKGGRRVKRNGQGKRSDEYADGEEVGILEGAELEELRRVYHQKENSYRALLEEVVFILQDKIAAKNIKIHGIEKRIKELLSVEAKCHRKRIRDLGVLVDIVGTRVVCLFRSDMSKVGDLISANFDVLSIDDKVSTDGPLGYMSVHYICKMPERYSGPRYENTREIHFEIQVRTLCMHAWAAVSHYLDYKGEWDVPEELKRALNALGGLFYVADNEFEQFYKARLSSKSEAERTSGGDEDQEINLDTMASFLRKTFPDREHTGTTAVSDLIHEIKRAGYTSMKEVSDDIKRGRDAFDAYEEQHPPHPGPRFTDVGVVRITLNIVSPSMREVGRPKAGSLSARYAEFEPFVRAT